MHPSVQKLSTELRHKAAEFWRHPGFQRYLGNTGWLFGGQMLRMVLALFVSVAVARYLGPAQLGLLDYVTSIVALIMVFSGLGLQSIAKRDMVQTPEKKNVILGSAFILNLISSVICYLLMMVGAFYSSASPQMMILFSLLGGIIIIQPFDYIEQWFQAQVRSNLSVISSSTALLLFSALKVAAILREASLVTFAWLTLFEAVTVISLKIYFYNKHYGSLFNWQVNTELAKSMLRQSWPLVISGLSVTLYMRVDTIMLMEILGEKATGEYTAATRISTIWYFIPQILASSLLPAVINAKKNSLERYWKRLNRYLLLSSSIGYVICISVSFLSGFIIHTLYGNLYQQSAQILSIHAWSALFVFIGVARSQYLITEGLLKFSMFSTMVGCVVNLLANFILIPRYGGVGAAISTLCAQFCSAFLSSFFYQKTWQIGYAQLRALLPFLYLFRRS